LEVPLRERNVLLVAAGFAPVFRERALQDPALAAARAAVDLVLKGHEPYPALAIDRHWTMVAANAAVARLIGKVPASLIEPQANVLRLSLHPQGLSPRIANLPEWRAHLLERLRRQIEVSADPVLVALLDELQAYPVPGNRGPRKAYPAAELTGVPNAVVVPLQLVAEAGTLSLFSTTTVFGTPVDVTLSELALECFYPADTATAEALRRMASP
jgi:hypothetical protein